MKHQYLLLSLFLWLSLCLDDITSKVIFFIMCILFFNQRRWGSIKSFTILLFLSMIFTLPMDKIDKPKDYIMKIEKIKENYSIAKSSNDRFILYNLKDVDLNDVIKVEGEFEEIKGLSNFYGFNFKAWCDDQKIYYQMNVKNYTKVDTSNSIATKLWKTIHEIEDNESMKWILNTLYAYSSDQEHKLAYFISASGLHIALLGSIIYRLSTRYTSNQNAHMISLFTMGIIGYLTCFPSSFVRVLIFRSVSFICFNLNAKDKLGISMWLWLLIFPRQHLAISFILPVIFRLSGIFYYRKLPKIMSQYLILIPVQLFYFYECDLLSIVMFPVFRYLFLIFYLVAWLSILIPIMMEVIPFFIHLQNVMLDIPIPTLMIVGSPSILWLFYWAKMSIQAFTHHKRRYYYQFLLLLLWQQYSIFTQPYYEVMFINVGQGDSAIISAPFGRGTMMIDIAGNCFKNIPNDIVYPILKAKGISQVDQLVISHDDFDHSGGIKELQELIQIDKIITDKSNDIHFANIEFKSLLSNIDYGDINENSMVLYTEIEKLSFLFMGDAGIPFEQDFMNEYSLLHSDILKVGHHGSNSSSSALFLQQIHPNIAFISSGMNNRYGHPHKEVLDQLNNQSSFIVNSADQGALRIRIFPIFSFIQSSEGILSFIMN